MWLRYAVLGVALLACGSEPRSARQAVSSDGTVAESLRFTLIVPPRARVGAAVPITLRLTNPSAQPIEARFLGREIAFDVVVVDRAGRPVWRRLADRAIPSILRLQVLAPGETLEWQAEWRAARTGRYRVQGVLPSDDPEPRRTAWAEIEITRR